MADIKITPEQLEAQAASLLGLKNQYQSLFSSVTSELNAMNSNWSQALSNNFSSKITAATQGFSSVVNMLENGASAARQAAQSFESVDQALAKTAAGEGNFNKGNDAGAGMLNAVTGSIKGINQAASFGMSAACAYSADPVNLCNGNFVFEKTLILIESSLMMKFGVFYNIQKNDKNILGTGWTHNYEIYLSFLGDTVSVAYDDGAIRRFQDVGDKYVSLDGGSDKFVKVDDKYILSNKEQISYVFNESGKLIEINDCWSGKISVSYENDCIQKVEDNYGNYLLYEYDFAGSLAKVVDHDGRTVSFNYVDDQLVELIDAENRVTKFEYDSNRWMIKMINPNGVPGIQNEFDDTGRTIRQIFADGGIVVYTYDDSNNTVTMREQNGNEIKYVHDEFGRSIQERYINGSEYRTYDDNNNLSSFTDRNGNKFEYKFDDYGNLLSIVNPLSETVEFEYTDYNQINKIVVNGVITHSAKYNDKKLLDTIYDAMGASVSYEYDDESHLVSLNMPDGSRQLLTYDAKGNIQTVSNTMGGLTTFYYDSLNRVIETVDALGNSTKYSYNNNNEMTRVEDANGNVRIYSYDACGNIIHALDFNGAETVVEYNEVNKPVRIVDPDGNATVYEYDEMWNVKKLTAADGAVSLYEYDALQRMIGFTDAEGNYTKLVYDNNGNIIERIEPNGAVHKIEYDELNRPIRVVDPCGRDVVGTYDKFGNVVETVFNGEFKEICEYDYNDNITVFIDRSGYRTEFKYDIMGNLVSISDDNGIKMERTYYPGGLLKSEANTGDDCWVFEYDLNENVTKTYNQKGLCYSFEYDALGRVSKTYQNDVLVESFEYDAVGKIITHTDGEGDSNHYEYTLTGNLKKMTDALGNETLYAYDACNRLVEIMQNESGAKSANGINSFNESQKSYRSTKIKRDFVGNVVAVTDPEGNTSEYTYNANSKITHATDADGNEFNIAYHLDGLEKEYSFGDGKRVKFLYNEMRQLVELEDWLGITRLESDPMNRVTKIVRPDSSETSYSYRADGTRESVVYPNGKKLNYEFDSLRRISAITLGEDRVDFEYSSANQIIKRSINDSITTSFSYDSSNRIIEACHNVGSDAIERMHYGYDSLNRISSVLRERKNGNSGLFEYLYNAQGSLSQVSLDGQIKEKYAYDIFGNRTKSFAYGNEASYEYNRLDQLIKMTDADGVHSYEYDKRGNLIKEILNNEIDKEYTFNVFNRIAEVKSQNSRTVYSYDGFGMRISDQLIKNNQIISSRSYVYDLLRKKDNLLSFECDGISESYIWSEREIIAAVTSDRDSIYFLNDERSTPLSTFSKSGKSSYYDMDSFGNSINPHVANSRFTTFQPDYISGNNNANFREYSPKTGRFISMDRLVGSIAVPLAVHKYAYCISDPINYLDPTGEIWHVLAGGIVGAAAKVVTKAAGDIGKSVVKSIKTGKPTWAGSSLQEYAGAAVGGFVQGAITMTGHPVLAASLGNMAETATTTGLNVVTGVEGYRREDGYNLKKFASEMAVSGVEGAVAGAAGTMFGNIKPKIKTLTAGRGSDMAVWKQVVTKSINGQIKDISWGTVGKGIIAYAGVAGIGALGNSIKKTAKSELEDFAKTTIGKFIHGGSLSCASSSGSSVNVPRPVNNTIPAGGGGGGGGGHGF